MSCSFYGRRTIRIYCVALYVSHNVLLLYGRRRRINSHLFRRTCSFTLHGRRTIRIYCVALYVSHSVLLLLRTSHRSIRIFLVAQFAFISSHSDSTYHTAMSCSFFTDRTNLPSTFLADVEPIYISRGRRTHFSRTFSNFFAATLSNKRLSDKSFLEYLPPKELFTPHLLSRQLRTFSISLPHYPLPSTPPFLFHTTISLPELDLPSRVSSAH